jgi:predicted GNAT family N-acyltransferase
MVNEINYMSMKSGQEARIFNLISTVFDEFVEKYFLEEGRNEFLKYIDPNSLKERSQSNHINIVALQNQNPIGFIEIRDYNQVSLFFVAKEFQRKGIGKELIRRSVDLCLQKKSELQKITVNASPNSVPAYKQLGFIEEGYEQIKNGIRFAPMALNLVNKYTGNR